MNDDTKARRSPASPGASKRCTVGHGCTGTRRRAGASASGRGGGVECDGLSAPSSRGDGALPSGRGQCRGVLRASRRARVEPAALRSRGVRGLSRLRTLGTRFRSRQVHGVPPRVPGGLQLQAPRLVPLLRGAAHGGDGRAPGRERAAARADGRSCASCARGIHASMHVTHSGCSPSPGRCACSSPPIPSGSPGCCPSSLERCRARYYSARATGPATARKRASSPSYSALDRS